MKKRTKSPVIYVGPGFPDTDLATYKIFADGVPDEYADHPIYKHLFVSPKELETARKEIGQTGSLRYVFYKKALEEHAKKGGK